MLNLQTLLNTKIPDLSNKQSLFFKNVFRDIQSNSLPLAGKKAEEASPVLVSQEENTRQVQEPMKSHISGFQEMGFSLLKGKTWKYHIKKFQVIIGRSSQTRDSCITSTLP